MLTLSLSLSYFPYSSSILSLFYSPTGFRQSVRHLSLRCPFARVSIVLISISWLLFSCVHMYVCFSSCRFLRPSLSSYVCLSFYSSVWSFLRPSVDNPRPSTVPALHISVRPSLHPSVCPSIRPARQPTAVHCSCSPTFFCLLPLIPVLINRVVEVSKYLSIGLTVCLSVILSVCVLFCLSVILSVCLLFYRLFCLSRVQLT